MQLAGLFFNCLKSTALQNTQGESPSGDAEESNSSSASLINIATPFPKVTTMGSDPGMSYLQLAPLRDVGSPQASSSCSSVTPGEIMLP
jgi:hypothetical protein